MTATATQPAFALVPLSAITESRTNPRKAFDATSLKELTDSVRQFGVLQPVLLRRLAGDRYEVVAGARRFRAASAAGLAEIPAVVRELDDKATLEVQVIENLQRQDLHPLEEADGYRLLHAEHGYSVDELAAKVGKSKAYVYARLRLCDLPKGARKLFLAGKLDASRALLVARIPVAKIAEEAALEIVDNEFSFRDASEHVQYQYMLRLNEAPFPTGDKDLVPAAGACGSCPKRTGNQKGLFDDVPSADVCTDTKCYHAKCEAWFARRADEVKSKGGQVLEGKAADDVRYHSGSGAAGLMRLDACCDEDPKGRHWRAVLGKRVSELPVTLLRFKDGKTEERVSRKAALALAKELGHKFDASRASSGGADDKWRQDRERKEKRHRARLAVCRSMREQLISAAEVHVDKRTFMLFLVEDLIQRHSNGVKPILEHRGIGVEKYGAQLSKSGRADLAKLSELALRGLALEIVAFDNPSNSYEDRYSDRWLAACALLGIDMKKVEAEHAKKGAGAKKAKAVPKAGGK